MVLPDVLGPDLQIVFCGTAVGDKSARAGAYYAGPGNKFWPVLHEIGLTPRQFEPNEFKKLSELGIGLTDLVKSVSGADRRVRGREFDRDGFREKIERYAPTIVAFNGKRAGGEFFRRPVAYGHQQETIGTSAAYVLPSTSGAASGFWDVSFWHEVGRTAAKLRKP